MSRIWRHKKRMALYVVLCDDALIEATGERAVAYQCLSDGRVWIRPYDEFHDGRFEKITSVRNNFETGETALSINRDF